MHSQLKVIRRVVPLASAYNRSLFTIQNRRTPIINLLKWSKTFDMFFFVMGRARV
jgi:hypothetical protein